MYKVLIIDDEHMIREVLRKKIDWESMGCEVVGEAVNGLDGFNLVEQLEPDLVLSDISMPGIDGIEMASALKDKFQDTVFIFITGYRDFEYASRALKVGAKDFILKPIKLDVIVTTVKETVEELKRRDGRNKEIEELKNQAADNYEALRERALFNMIHGFENEPENMTYYEEVYGFEGRTYVMFLFSTEEQKVCDDKLLYQLSMKNYLMNHQGDMAFDYIVLSKTETVVLIWGNGYINDSWLENICGQLKTHVEDLFELKLSCSISKKHESIGALNVALSECHKALEYEFYFGKYTVLNYAEIERNIRVTSDKYKMLISYQSRLIKHMLVGDVESCEEDLDCIIVKGCPMKSTNKS